jgi:hypothetical protein
VKKTVTTKPRETSPIRAAVSRIQGVDGKSDGFVVITEDINDQRKTTAPQTQAAWNSGVPASEAHGRQWSV